MKVWISRLAWAFGGALIGSIISLSIDKLILPHFEKNPNIEISSKSIGSEAFMFTVRNSGTAEVEDLQISIKYSTPLPMLFPLKEVEPIKSNGASCEYKVRGTFTDTWTSEKTFIHIREHSELTGMEFKCNFINPGSDWSAILIFKNLEADILAPIHIAYPGSSRSTLVFFKRFSNG